VKIFCPSCDAAIQAAEMNLATGWAKCLMCNELFRIGDVVPGFLASQDSGPTPVVARERPFNARAELTEELDGTVIHVPPTGMRAGNWALLGFASFWTVFVAFWTIGATVAVFAPNGNPGWGILFPMFSIPFWLVGLGLLYGVFYSATARQLVWIGPQEMMTKTTAFLFHRERHIDRADVQHAQPHAPTVKSEDSTPSCGVEVVYRGGSYVIGCETKQEQAWLLYEINKRLDKDRPRTHREQDLQEMQRG
jgi:hypothetical protein